jgi:hypothetical protein
LSCTGASAWTASLALAPSPAAATGVDIGTLVNNTRTTTSRFRVLFAKRDLVDTVGLLSS